MDLVFIKVFDKKVGIDLDDQLRNKHTRTSLTVYISSKLIESMNVEIIPTDTKVIEYFQT